MIILFYPFLIRYFLQDEARNYMEERKVPKELQERILLWYDYAYQRYCITNISYDTCTICHTIYHMVWYGMVWYGMVWYGMVWYGMVWYGMVWYGMVWYDMVCIVWCGMVWYGVYSMVWYGMVYVWHGMVWHGMVW